MAEYLGWHAFVFLWQIAFVLEAPVYMESSFLKYLKSLTLVKQEQVRFLKL